MHTLSFRMTTHPPAGTTEPKRETQIRPVFRFAPSPNGRLHLGHAYAALVNLELARKAGGVMLLRIEDIDTARCTEANCAAMLRDLEWIGFEWDREPLRQSERFAAYRDALENLLGEGLAYPALLSRRQIAEAVERVTKQVDHWSGGTRIGHCLGVLKADFSRFLHAKSTLIMISDGCDLGELDLLEETSEN